MSEKELDKLNVDGGSVSINREDECVHVLTELDEAAANYDWQGNVEYWRNDVRSAREEAKLWRRKAWITLAAFAVFVVGLFVAWLMV